MKNIAIYPGSFDPITYGHLDLIKRALRIFDRVIVAVSHNPSKGVLFSVKERIEMIKRVTQGLNKRLSVEDFDGLLLQCICGITNSHRSDVRSIWSTETPYDFVFFVRSRGAVIFSFLAISLVM